MDVNGKVLTVGLILLGSSLVLGIVMLITSDVLSEDGSPYTDDAHTVRYDEFVLTENVSAGALEVRAPYTDLRIVAYDGGFDQNTPLANATHYYNCDPMFDDGNDPCVLKEWPSLSYGTTIVISGWSAYDTGDWTVSTNGTELANDTVSVSDPTMLAVDCCRTDGSDDLEAIGLLTCCCGLPIGIAITIAGVSMRDPAAAAAMTMVGGVPVAGVGTGLGLPGFAQPAPGQAAFVAQQAPLSQPMVHGAVPGMTIQPQPITNPATQAHAPTAPPPSSDPVTAAPTQATPSPTSAPTPPEPEQPPLAATHPPTEVPRGVEVDGNPPLGLDEATSALSDAFSSSERAAILARMAPQDLAFTVEEERRTMGVGISERLRGGQTIAGTLPGGQEAAVRLPASERELEIGDPWKGRGKAVDWNAIRKTLVFDSE